MHSTNSIIPISENILNKILKAIFAISIAINKLSDLNESYDIKLSTLSLSIVQDILTKYHPIFAT